MTFYDDQLQNLQQQMAKKTHLEAILKDLYNQETELQEKAAELYIAKQNEQADVDKLEGYSLSAFFYGIVGKKDEKLDKERQEAYVAADKYNTATRELAAVREDIKYYCSELNNISKCRERYEQVLEEKAEAIKESGIPEAAQILQLQEQLSCLENQSMEIGEAISVGRTARSTADAILHNLEDARNWGTRDLADGGLIAHIKKYDSLDSANELTEELRVQLSHFKAELANISIHANMQVNVDGFLRFADHSFGGVFADVEVLNRIGESQGQAQTTKWRIEDALNKLSSMLSVIKKEQAIAKSRLDKLITETVL